jgi:YfiH family protein
MVRFHGDPPTHLTLEVLERAGVRHAYTTRHHGQVRARPGPGAPLAMEPGPALAALGVDVGSVRFVRQVHGVSCLVVDGGPPGLVGEGDALISTRRGVPLAVFSADCVTLVLADRAAGVLAAAHAGWRGTVAGLAGRLVATLVERAGVRPDRLVAAIGPSIGPCCYEVDGPVVEPLRAAFPTDWARWVTAKGPGKWWLDLWQATTDQLTAAGVPAGAIVNPRLCTACGRALFFSYRREGPGRSLAAIAVLD